MKTLVTKMAFVALATLFVAAGASAASARDAYDADHAAPKAYDAEAESKL